MTALLAIGADAPGVAKAILDLSADPDPYIADQAMIQLEKNGGVASLDTKTRVAGLSRALEGKLPRGRGHVMRMIQRLPEEERKMLIPAMLKNAAWSPTRDMMFSLAGRDASIKLLTHYRAKELITLIPVIIQAKERGRDQIRAECFKALEAFGDAARAAVPGLEDYLETLDTDHRDLQKLAGSRQRDGWIKSNRAEHKLVSDLIAKLSK